MSLEETLKRTKKEQAEELALKYKDLPILEQQHKIMEEIPCSRSTALNAIKKISDSIEREKSPEPQKPQFKLGEEEQKEPAYLPPSQTEAPIESIEPEKPMQPLTLQPEAAEEQLDLFRDMLRGMHNLILSKEGILGERYGRTQKQCEQASDQLFRWLCRRYSLEDLEKWDTILLIGSYGTLIGGIIKEYVAERRKTLQKAEK